MFRLMGMKHRELQKLRNFLSDSHRGVLEESSKVYPSEEFWKFFDYPPAAELTVVSEVKDNQIGFLELKRDESEEEGKREMAQRGKVSFVKEDGLWKIFKEEWNNVGKFDGNLQ